ncbi:MAG: NAD-dependent epimerase/dehydratase family protein [Chloroflexi bacterium]|nr:NAD-dependent epimerase/dehydratase family protein [Chloroflexota bacterium]
MNLRGKNLLVTGGAGFIGSHLVDRLILEEPAALVVVDNLWLGRLSNLESARAAYPALKFYRVDVAKARAMKNILEKEHIDVVFDLATIPLPASLTRPKWSARQIYEMALDICELGRLGYYDRLIHCSSSEVYGSAAYVPMDEEHPLLARTPYAAAKAAADLLVRSYQDTFGLKAMIVRPFNNYGPRQNDKNYAGVIPIVIRRILAGKAPIIYGDGEQTRDYSFVTDVADGIARLAQTDAALGQVVNIASGQEISVNRLVRGIAAAMNYDGPIEYAAERPGDVRRHLAAIDRARALIDYKPLTPLEIGLKRTVEWYLGQIEHSVQSSKPVAKAR